MHIDVLTTQDLGVAIRAVRKSKGIRLDHLAEDLGVSKQTTASLEYGKATVQLGTALRHLEALGIKVRLEFPEEAEPFLEGALEKIARHAEQPPAPTTGSDAEEGAVLLQVDLQA